MQTKQKFIEHDFNLPCHNNQLSIANDCIEKLKTKLKTIETRKTINDKEHELLFEEIFKVLDYVGRLSMSAFEISEELEKMYTLRYNHSPELARKLWLDHYEEIHHPYNLLKNRCFKLIDELDEQFIKFNKRQPKNWNI